MLLEMVAMQAVWHPDEESDLFSRLELGSDPTLLLKLIHSRNISHFLLWTPGIGDYRYTNEALLGVFLDDQYNPIPILQT